MRCPSCGHDMLPEDIAQRPLVDRGLMAESAAAYNKALFDAKTDLATRLISVVSIELQQAVLADQNPAELIEATRRMKANRWRIWPILGALVLYALLSVLVLPAR
jgi:hypothetical protein